VTSPDSTSKMPSLAPSDFWNARTCSSCSVETMLRQPRAAPNRTRGCWHLPKDLQGKVPGVEIPDIRVFPPHPAHPPNGISVLVVVDRWRVPATVRRLGDRVSPVLPLLRVSGRSNVDSPAGRSVHQPDKLPGGYTILELRDRGMGKVYRANRPAAPDRRGQGDTSPAR